MSDGRVLGMRVVGLDRTDHNFAGVHADTDLQIDSLFRAQLLGEALDLFLHAQSGEHGALRMVLVRDGRTKQRKDAVAGRLHDVAAIPMRRIDHQLERRINDRTRFFRIEVFHQIHRTLDVGEHRGDRLALSIRDVSVGRFQRYPHQ